MPEPYRPMDRLENVIDQTERINYILQWYGNCVPDALASVYRMVRTAAEASGNPPHPDPETREVNAGSVRTIEALLTGFEIGRSYQRAFPDAPTVPENKG